MLTEGLPEGRARHIGLPYPEVRLIFINLRKLCLKLVKNGGASSVPSHIREELKATGELLGEFKSVRPDLYDYTSVSEEAISLD